MKVSKRERTLIIVVLLLAAVSAYYLLFLKPYMTEIGELNVMRANSEIQVETYAQLKTNIDLLDTQIEEKETEIIEYSKDITVGFDQPPVLVYLENTVDKHAQKMMFAFGMAEYMGQMTISPVTITMKTTYEGLTSFINEVTQDDFIINVTNIDARQAVIDETVIEEVDEDITVEDIVEEGSEDAPVTPAIEDVSAEESEYLLQVTITIEIYTMAGDVPSDAIYVFDDNEYNYGGDIFYQANRYIRDLIYTASL